MIKWLFGLALLFIGFWGWNEYGYLVTSYKNWPPNEAVNTEPTSLKVPDTTDPKLAHLKLPPGFMITYFSSDVPGARSLAKGSAGTIYVGSRPQGVVYALEDSNQDGTAENRYVIASGLNSPNGVAYLNGDLYVAEIHRIIKFSGIDSTFKDKPKPTVVYDKLPRDEHHGWKYLSIGPDNKLYVAIGVPCNVCDNGDPYGTILRLNLDGSDPTIVARGIRNSVGFDWNPKDGSLWFTDNGRDNMGDDVPPDELNKVGGNIHFGFPYCHAGTIPDPSFGKGKNCSDYIAPTSTLGPHVAALGMKFYEGSMFPPEYKNKVLIAEHGSWNRKVPIGYRVTMLDINGDTSSNYTPLFTGWLGEGKGSKVTGRPVDLLELDDGSLLISDDYSGAVYRVTYK